jgi:hypothetical protein
MSKPFFGSLAVRLAVSTVAAGLFVGCEKSETKPASSSGSAPAASDAAKTAADSAKNSADSAKGAASDAAKSAGDAAKSAGDAAGAAASNASATISGDKSGAAAAAPAAPADAAAAAPADSAAAATGDAKAQATDLLTKVTTYVKENKMDLAEKALAELDKLKPQLPAEYQSKIDAAHTMFDTAKKGKGLGELKDNLLGK